MIKKVLPLLFMLSSISSAYAANEKYTIAVCATSSLENALTCKYKVLAENVKLDVFIVKENEKLVANEVKSEINLLLANMQNIFPQNRPFLNDNVINFQVLKKMMHDAFVSDMVDLSSQINIIDDQNEVYNKPIYEKLKLFFIILGSVTAGLIVLYNIGLYNKISYKYYFSELIISIIIAFGLIALYQYLFVS